MRAHQESDQILDTATFRIVESVEKFVILWLFESFKCSNESSVFLKEDLLMTNNLFVDYFNIFLQNPVILKRF